MKKPSYRDLLKLIFFILLSLSSRSLAFLGGNINEFKNYFKKSFELSNCKKAGNITHYYFFLNSPLKSSPQIPGFNAAMTISLESNKIIGESLVIDIGKNKDNGIVLATTLLMDLVIEARQTKPPPKNTLNTQFIIFKQSLIDALNDNSQTLNYDKEKITIKIEQIDLSKVLITIMKQIENTQ